jgi:hypothetical protein
VREIVKLFAAPEFNRPFPATDNRPPNFLLILQRDGVDRNPARRSRHRALQVADRSLTHLKARVHRLPDSARTSQVPPAHGFCPAAEAGGSRWRPQI